MVNRYYIFKDCTQIGSTETRDEASTAARSSSIMKKRMKKER